MRNLLAVMFVGVVAASSFGVVNFNVSTMGADQYTLGNSEVTIGIGETLTVALYGNSTTFGIQSIAGDIVATGTAGALQTQAGLTWLTAGTHVGTWGELIPNAGVSFAGVVDTPWYTMSKGQPVGWNSTYDGFDNSTNPPTPIIDGYRIGAPKTAAAVAGANGGYNRIGSIQGDLVNPTGWFGQEYDQLLTSYTVTGMKQGVVILNWVDLGNNTGGYDGNYTVTVDKVRDSASLSGLTVNVTPEPATMALLALGGLLVARRRHA